MKKTILFQCLLFGAPLLFYFSSKQELVGLIEDNRPVHQSLNLMSIHG